ncbi:Flp pilus assembly protein, protease CpaA [Thalassovita gelatinovora]|uniref:Flp pilus assembly protein, protease CpaA n=1 Tax=Thalassovita gelatinovora TaxID=53501 RepID=A0A0N7LUR5_THAGE|nr:prepilin peptidase [Thalassovita gelatinovora]CUH64234.1 Flp pilus assembly protein, protease CpaA [Thalassovita gelatinovora]SEQ94647.1 prepilin peptidase CpaA [Thalassovita gelatinovora]
MSVISTIAPTLQLPQSVALWLFVVSLPACLWSAWSDLRIMKIPNKAVMLLTIAFVVAAPFLMSLQQVGWQLLQLVILLLIGMVMNGAGLIGAGDAKFTAAAAPYIMLGDWKLVVMLFATVTLASVATHRLAGLTPLRNLAPDWESWTRKGDFPMGLPLGFTLSLYLLIGAVYGG